LKLNQQQPNNQNLITTVKQSRTTVRTDLQVYDPESIRVNTS
jgi:hypothetical protein